MCHQGMLRVSELLKLVASDVSFVLDVNGKPRAVRLLLRDSKTAEYNKARGNQEVFIPLRADTHNYCVVSLLSHYMRTNGLLDDAFQVREPKRVFVLFPSAQGGDMPLTKPAYTIIVRLGLISIGLSEAEATRISANSFRAGGACDYRDSGVPPEIIIIQGRWRSTAWMRYFRASPDVSCRLLNLSIVSLNASELASRSQDKSAPEISLLLGTIQRLADHNNAALAAAAARNSGPVSEPVRALHDALDLVRNAGFLAVQPPPSPDPPVLDLSSAEQATHLAIASYLRARGIELVNANVPSPPALSSDRPPPALHLPLPSLLVPVAVPGSALVPLPSSSPSSSSSSSSSAPSSSSSPSSSATSVSSASGVSASSSLSSLLASTLAPSLAVDPLSHSHRSNRGFVDHRFTGARVPLPPGLAYAYHVGQRLTAKAGGPWILVVDELTFLAGSPAYVLSSEPPERHYVTELVEADLSRAPDLFSRTRGQSSAAHAAEAPPPKRFAHAGSE